MEKSELNSHKLSFLWEHTTKRMAMERPEWVLRHRPEWLLEHRREWLLEHKKEWVKEHRPELFLDHKSESMLTGLIEELEKDENN